MSDVCLVLEGTYPYVRGGVSSWVHQMIKHMQDVKFSLLTIMPNPSFTKTERYPIPENVQSIINIYLHDYSFQKNPLRKRNPEIFRLFELFLGGINRLEKEKLELFLLKMTENKELLDNNYAFTSRDFWRAVTGLYEREDPTLSFIDFFWNYRFTFLPLMQVMRSELPPAPLYHTISTGYAGIMAALAKIKYNSHLLLTEHRIYTKERRIEIAQASWIYEMEVDYVKATTELGYFKQWWTNLFSVMSGLCYTYSDLITTLYEGNRQTQIAEGADPKKTLVIPNGINIRAHKEAMKGAEKRKRRRTVAYVGRVVPIKDVKTFIKACKIIVERMPDVRILIVGPQEEESQYYQECVILINILGLKDNIYFTGHVDLKKYYPTIDVIVLTSISEAQPLVILEAAACGIPSVATDVGSCRELLEGIDDDDKALGPGGIITPFYSPGDTAEGVIRLLDEDGLYESMSRAAIERCTRYYDEEDMIVKYKNLYEQYI